MIKQGQAQQRTPHNMAHIVAIHLALRAHQGRTCHWCDRGLIRNCQTEQLLTCTHCHGFGQLETPC